MIISEAIILAGGLGTRLRSAVPDLPKCMAPVNGVPFIRYVIEHLQSEGIEHFIFAVGYKHEVIVEYGSYRALERARQNAPQVYLLDIGLPEIDGYQLARRLREQPGTAHAVLIAITGYGQEHDRKNALDAGFDHHLVKPVDTAKLATILAELPSG